MKDYQERVVQEKAELETKIRNLVQFIGGDDFKGLPSPEKDRLANQLRVMQVYLYILGQRISFFE
jgi:Txe/YoeB family toxin of Txe-Axe toxin-antitoxin module